MEYHALENSLNIQLSTYSLYTNYFIGLIITNLLLLITRLFCLVNIPNECKEISITDIEYLQVYGFVAQIITDVSLLKKNKFAIISFFSTNIIFSAISNTKTMQWCLSDKIIWTWPMITMLCIFAGFFIAVFIYNIFINYHVDIKRYWGPVLIIYLFNIFKIVYYIYGDCNYEFHHYWIAWNILLLCRSNELAFAICYSIFIQGIGVYGADPIQQC